MEKVWKSIGVRLAYILTTMTMETIKLYGYSEHEGDEQTLPKKR